MLRQNYPRATILKDLAFWTGGNPPHEYLYLYRSEFLSGGNRSRFVSRLVMAGQQCKSHHVWTCQAAPKRPRSQSLASCYACLFFSPRLGWVPVNRNMKAANDHVDPTNRSHWGSWAIRQPLCSQRFSCLQINYMAGRLPHICAQLASG